MRGSLLGLVFGVLFVATTSCGKDESPSEDNDAGAGGQDAGAGRGGARAGRGGTAGSGTAGSTSGGGGRGGNANGGSGGGSGGGDAGGSDAGESGAGGATEGGSAGMGGGKAGAGGSAGTVGGGAGKAGGGAGSGGNAGKAGGGAGSGGNAGRAGGAGTAGSGAGSGGNAGSATGCERTPQGAVLVDADFSTDVFASSAWTRSDTSVSLSGGIVTIGADTGWDDYIRVAPSGATLPLVVELRQRTIESNPHTEVVPVNEIHFGDITLRVTYATDLGWLFNTSSAHSGSQINAPLQGEWITMRALLGINSSELCAKKDGEAAFTRVASSGTFRLPAVLQDVHVRQAWDYRYEMSDLRIQRP